ncbi:MAG: polysaccharide deacetylase family protein [Nitrospirae bacterium]|nr:polysaccharide deacetylase family protein [Candidatus Manganitrophaceae bacterium]
MKLIVTIDTEEDNWGNYIPKGYSLGNISQIPAVQDLFDEFDILPTYLITYSVATDPSSSSILRRILDRGRCEIGMHCHPWHTPPLEEKSSEENSMLCNLPGDLQFRKIERLHEAIVKSFDIAPLSFRAGRWGHSKDVAAALSKLGCKVDSSILSLVDWTRFYGPNFSNAFPDPYWFNPEEIFRPDAAGKLLEVPATVGFTQTNFQFSNDLFNFLQRDPFHRLRLIGLLDKLGLLNKIWLSPEQARGDEMIALAKTFLKKKAPLINLYFHSPTLQPGLTSYVQTEGDKQAFIEKLRMFFSFTKEAGIESIRLSDAVSVVPSC